MAHAWDIVGYVGDGAILCPDCGEKYGAEEVTPIFADSEDLRPGETCGDCGAFTKPDREWTCPRGTADYWEDAEACRWVRCPACNHYEPRWKGDADARRATLYQRDTCPNCRRASLRH